MSTGFLGFLSGLMATFLSCGADSPSRTKRTRLTALAQVPLGAHEAGVGLAERTGESPLPLVRSHPGCVAPEGADPDAGEALLARLAGAAAAQLDSVPVFEALRLERL